MENNKLPDTPWHIGYTKKDEDDPRRHKARCYHYKKGMCGLLANYGDKCIGSSHCIHYAESKEEFEALSESQMTIEEIQEANIRKYRKSLEPKKERLAREGCMLQYKGSREIKECLVCGDRLNHLGYTLQQCKFCGMYFVNAEEYENVIDIVKAEPVLLMNISRKKNKGSVENKKKGIYVVCRK